MNILNFYNPVAEYYKNFLFAQNIPVIDFYDYTTLLQAAEKITSSCILVNNQRQTVKDTELTLNFKFAQDLKIVFILNIEFTGKSSVILQGDNYSVSNIYLNGGDPNFEFETHILSVFASNITLINFEMENLQCSNSDLDYIRVYQDAKNFQMMNSKLNGKFNKGVFLRLDFPDHHVIKNCVFQKFSPISEGNGGEMIRMATSGLEEKEAFSIIDSCLFSFCEGDPEVISVKCSSNTIQNCIFTNNGGKRLTIRHGHNCTISHCFFDTDGMRIYGTNHLIKDIQLNNGANLNLDNKSGSSYVVAENCTLLDIYYNNTPNPVTNNGINCTITNLSNELKFTIESMLDPVAYT